MKTEQLKQFAIDLFEKRVEIYFKNLSIPDYQGQYTVLTDDIKTESIYGIGIDGVIEYDFKTGKKEDNIMKTFVTQYINKYATKQVIDWNIEDGFIKANKQDIISNLKNSDRVSKYYFYTTLYGIGYFCYFMSKKAHTEAKTILANYLKSKNVSYENEFSEAGWVYRFVLNQDVKTHNNLLSDLEI